MILNEWKLHLRKRLQEDAVPGYVSPEASETIDSQSQNITQFEPIPAEKVLKEVTVDESFLSELLNWAGVDVNATAHIVSCIIDAGASGTLMSSHVTNIVSQIPSTPQVPDVPVIGQTLGDINPLDNQLQTQITPSQIEQPQVNVDATVTDITNTDDLYGSQPEIDVDNIDTEFQSTSEEPSSEFPSSVEGEEETESDDEEDEGSEEEEKPKVIANI